MSQTFAYALTSDMSVVGAPSGCRINRRVTPHGRCSPSWTFGFFKIKTPAWQMFPASAHHHPELPLVARVRPVFADPWSMTALSFGTNHTRVCHPFPRRRLPSTASRRSAIGLTVTVADLEGFDHLLGGRHGEAIRASRPEPPLRADRPGAPSPSRIRSGERVAKRFHILGVLASSDVTAVGHGRAAHRQARTVGFGHADLMGGLDHFVRGG